MQPLAQNVSVERGVAALSIYSEGRGIASSQLPGRARVLHGFTTALVYDR